MTECVHQWVLGRDGMRLSVQDHMLSDQRVRGNLVLIHGLGEHSGRYAHVIDKLNEAGWQVRSYDQRGHGKSDGARGDVPGPNSLIEDAQAIITDFARITNSVPVLLGHSMGGLVAAHYASTKLSPIRALVLSSPALALPMSAVQKFLLKTMGAIAPGVGVSNGLQTRYLSHDSSVESAYKTDPMVHGKITARMVHGMQASIESAHTNANALDIPVLMLVAGDDHLVDARGSRQFFARLNPHHATLHWYDKLYHEVFNETEKFEVLNTLTAWLAALPTTGSGAAS